MTHRKLTLAVLLTLLLVAAWAMASEGMGSPAAKAEFEKGRAAQQSGEYEKAAAAFRKAIEIDPDYVEAHSSYAWASKLAVTRDEPAAEKDAKVDPKVKEEREKKQKEEREKVEARLTEEYEAWAKQHPDKAVYQWVLGSFYDYKDRLKAAEYYKRAVGIDPKFARAYMSLSLMEELRGEETASRDYMKKAVDANPAEPQYLFYYARKWKEENPAEYKRLALEVASKFPAHERGAQALYWLAADSDDPKEKLGYLKQLQKQYPPEKFRWSANGANMLYEIYAETDASKGLKFAEEMERLLPNEKSVKDIVKYQRNLVIATELMSKPRYTEAAEALLDKTNPPSRYFDATRLYLMRAEAADRAGHTEKAYTDLMKVAAEKPSDALMQALQTYAAKAKKTPAQVAADLWKERDSKAKAAKEFALEGFDSKKYSLADFKNKVVLLNFWYPG